MGESLQTHVPDKGLHSRIEKKLLQLSNKKITTQFKIRAKDLKRLQTDGKHAEWPSVSGTIREMQLETTLYIAGWSHEKKDHDRWQRCGEAGTFIRRWREFKTCPSFWKTVWWWQKWLNSELPYDPATALLGTYAGEKETCPTNTCTQCSGAHNSQQPEDRNAPNAHQVRDRYGEHAMSRPWDVIGP